MNEKQSNSVADAVDNLVEAVNAAKEAATKVERAQDALVLSLVANKPDIGVPYMLRRVSDGFWEATWAVPAESCIRVGTNGGPEDAANKLRKYLEFLEVVPTFTASFGKPKDPLPCPACS